MLNTDTECLSWGAFNLCVKQILDGVKSGKRVLQEEENPVPLELTIFKLMKRAPIVIFSVYEPLSADGHIGRNHVVKGSSEIQNIIKWIEKDISVSIQGTNVSYKKLSEEEKYNIFERSGGILSIPVKGLKNYEERLPYEEIIDIVKTCY